MNKIWIPIVIFVLIIGGGIFYNGYVLDKTDHMLNLADVAYREYISGGDCEKHLKEIESDLEKISGLLCAFLDRDIINEAKDAIVYSKGITRDKDKEGGAGIMMMREKISHIKNTAQIKLKYIL